MKVIQAFNKGNTLIIFLLILFSCDLVHAQVSAGFTVSDTLGCSSLKVDFTNTGSSGADYRHQWRFTANQADTSILENPSFTFHQGGTYEVVQTITHIPSQESASASATVTVLQTAPADLSLDTANACVNGDILFTTAFSNRDSVLWNFGDGNISRKDINYMYYAYETNGSYELEFITYRHDLICSDTSHYTIHVKGPVADISIDPESACKGESITFTMNPVEDVLAYSWEWDDGGTSADNPATHVFDTMGDITARLYVSGSSGICIIQDTFKIHEIYADFYVSDARCFQEPVVFFNSSEGNDVNSWDFGDGIPVLTENASYTFDGTGDFPVKLVVRNIEGCSDSIVQNVTVNPLPDISIGDDITICPGVGATLWVEGDHKVRWRPSYGLDDPNSFTPLANPEVDTFYTATITDTLTLCTNTAEVHVSLQEVFITGYIFVSPADTSVIIGDPVQFIVIDSLAGEREISYSWTPDEQISCTDCPSPVVQPLHTTVYTLEVSDDNQCEVSEIFDFTVEVTEEYRIGVAEAFTPNGDGINETIKVNGWGIKELIEFRIYNRAGKELYFSQDINEGWDGTYKGKLQPTGSYQYYIEAEMWDDNITSLNGTFTLLR